MNVRVIGQVTTRALWFWLWSSCSYSTREQTDVFIGFEENSDRRLRVGDRDARCKEISLLDDNIPSQKYRDDTRIPRYFATSAVVDKFSFSAFAICRRPSVCRL